MKVSEKVTPRHDGEGQPSKKQVGSGRNTVETPGETSLTRPDLFPEVSEHGQLDSMAEEALVLARAGWKVFPCHNKKPKTEGGFKDASNDPDLIRKWWTYRPKAQIGIAIPKGMMVLDIDPRHGGSREALEAVTGPLPETLTSWSGRDDGGHHLFFKVPPGFRISGRELPEGVDVKNSGKGYVIAPPSLHEMTRKVYAWERREIAEFPVEAWEARHRVNTGAPVSEGPGVGLIRTVANAQEGDRNNALHWALCRAFDDGGDDALIHELYATGLHIGLTESEIKATLESARNTPRRITQDFEPWTPQRAERPHQPAGNKRVRLVRASDIKPEKQNWLMHIDAEPVIPDKTCAVFAGIGGEGKSTFAIHVAALLSRGELEGDYHGQSHSSIIFGPEDDWSSVHVPRLMAAGADLDRIHKVVAEVLTPYGVQEQELRFPIDIELLEQAVIESRAKLVIVDPISVSMEGDLNKVQDVRDAVGALDALAKKHELTVILVNHFRKGGASVTEKMSGSHALRDVVRAYLAFATDKATGNRILTQDKNNYGTGLGSWKFDIQGRMINTDDGPTEAPYIEMLGASEVTVKDLIDREHGDAEDADDRTEWQAWLLEVLEEAGGKVPVKDIRSAATKAGFNFKTMQNGRAKIRNPKVVTGRDGFGTGSIPHWKFEHYSDPEEDFAVHPAG